MALFSFPRAAAIVGVLVVLFAALACRVAYLQTYGREATILSADREHNQTVVLPARRGTISDRNGLVMAGTIETKSLFIDPKFMFDYYQQDGRDLGQMDQAIAKLARVLDKKPEQLIEMLSDRSGARFVRIEENLDDNAIEEINNLDIPGAGIVSDSARSYPMGSLAAHVLGVVGADGHGIEGVELEYDKLLSGVNGYERVTKDARRHPIEVAADEYLPPAHGQHLVLTVDSNLQMILEQELRDTVEHVKAKRGEAVVMDPRTGEVLALANYPTYSLQTIGESSAEARRNNCLVTPFEPGSIFKPFMAGPALMWKVTTPWEVWPIPGITYHTRYGRSVTDVHAYGPLATWDGLVKSSNILMSMVAERMGNPRLYAAITSFGYGRRTGIDLPGESGGKVSPLRKWTYYSTESVAQGYEVLVTPIQICRAFCAIANGGRLVTPRVALGTVDSDGAVISRKPAAEFESLPQVLDADTALQLRRILCDVVIRGTAKGNRSQFWNIAGKTGTSHVAEGHGYSETKFNSSFIACAPFENPKLVVAFLVHEPDKSIAHYGGAVSAPGATRFLERALTYMQVEPSPDIPLPQPQVAAVLWDYSEKQYTDRSFGAPKEEVAGN